jgi:hypothetical protein
MRNKRLNLSVLLLFVLGLTGLQAQESVNASGGNALGSGGSVSWSIGQVVFRTYTGSNGSVVQGVQQPYEIWEVTGVEEAKDINLSISAYPNPATDILQLNVESDKYNNLSYQLYNMQGTLLQNEKINGTQTNISMCNLVSATYFVKVLKTNKEIKTFKIIKN